MFIASEGSAESFVDECEAGAAVVELAAGAVAVAVVVCTSWRTAAMSRLRSLRLLPPLGPVALPLASVVGLTGAGCVAELALVREMLIGLAEAPVGVEGETGAPEEAVAAGGEIEYFDAWSPSPLRREGPEERECD